MEVGATANAIANETATRAGLLYLGSILTQSEADEWLHWLLHEVAWGNAFYEAFGRRFPIPRQQAWFADAGIRYRYSDNLLTTLPWPERLNRLRQRVEALTGQRFNSVLATLYRSGEDSVGWHADDESELGPAPVIASLSVGATRAFCLRPKITPGHQHTHEPQPEPQPEIAVPVHSGDLWLMQPPCQQHWEHAVPAETSIHQPRVNLTFRWVIPPAS